MLMPDLNQAQEDPGATDETGTVLVLVRGDEVWWGRWILKEVTSAECDKGADKL